MATDRRGFLAGSLALTLMPMRLPARNTARIVVVGGGYGGATAARWLAALGHDVTLVEANRTYTSCPFSNTVLGGFGSMDALRFGYAGLEPVAVALNRAEAVDTTGKRVTLADGTALAYDRLVLAPGIDLHFNALEGYDEAAAEIMPHAWKAGAQTELLRRQLEAMEDGGTVAIVAPANPYRCPPGPYERACLIAHYLKAEKPRSKILILDAKDAFSKRPLFEEAWAELYPGMIEWVPMSAGGNVIRVDPETMVIETDFEHHQVDVANVIPPQSAGAIARAAGVVDPTGWCPVDPDTFESTLVPSVHVLGDACFAGAMPKSAFSANAQAKVAAQAIDMLLRDEEPPTPKLINTCYSLAAPDYGFTVAGVYAPQAGQIVEVDGSGGISPVEAPLEIRQLEAEYAHNWYNTITSEAFG